MVWWIYPCIRCKMALKGMGSLNTIPNVLLRIRFRSSSDRLDVVVSSSELSPNVIFINLLPIIFFTSFPPLVLRMHMGRQLSAVEGSVSYREQQDWNSSNCLEFSLNLYIEYHFSSSMFGLCIVSKLCFSSLDRCCKNHSSSWNMNRYRPPSLLKNVNRYLLMMFTAYNMMENVGTKFQLWE